MDMLNKYDSSEEMDEFLLSEEAVDSLLEEPWELGKNIVEESQPSRTEAIRLLHLAENGGPEGYEEALETMSNHIIWAQRYLTSIHKTKSY